jgi:hypothetical protein
MSSNPPHEHDPNDYDSKSFEQNYSNPNEYPMPEGPDDELPSFNPFPTGDMETPNWPMPNPQ